MKTHQKTKYILAIAILFVLLSSCIQPKKSLSFDYIDLTIADNWDRNYTININQNGETNINIVIPKSEKKQISYTIKKQILDSISNVALKVNFNNIKEEYNDSCKDCIGYSIRVYKNDKSYQTKVNNISQYTEVKELDKLVELLYNVIRTTEMDPESMQRKD